MPAWLLLKPNTDTASNAAFAGAPDRPEVRPWGVFVALAFLRAYKLLISPFFAGSCRFVPSCSEYARDAMTEHGVVRGSWLALRRLSRCHPFGSSGYDPAPRK